VGRGGGVVGERGAAHSPEGLPRVVVSEPPRDPRVPAHEDEDEDEDRRGARPPCRDLLQRGGPLLGDRARAPPQTAGRRAAMPGAVRRAGAPPPDARARPPAGRGGARGGGAGAPRAGGPAPPPPPPPPAGRGVRGLSRSWGTGGLTDQGPACSKTVAASSWTSLVGRSPRSWSRRRPHRRRWIAAGTTTLRPVSPKLPRPRILVFCHREPPFPRSVPACWRWQRRGRGAAAGARPRRGCCGGPPGA